MFLADAPLVIMDGDRGTNYPSQDEFNSLGHCLFLNTGNVTKDGFSFSNCAYISAEKDSILRKGKLVRGDIVLTTRGTVGNVALFDDEVDFEHVRINSGMVILRPDCNQLSSYFLYLFLRSDLFKEQAKSLQSGSAQPQLPIRDLKRIEIPIPPSKTQARICSLLGAFDDRINLLRETNSTLEAIAQALFKSWFVDFDPVRAKMEGLIPEGMDEATAALFPDAFEESVLGMVPRGWRNGLVSELGEVICGKTPSTKEAANYGDEVPFITIPDMHGLLVVTSTNRSLSRLGADSQRKKYLPVGAICVSCIATPGLVVRVTAEAQTNQQINSVVPSASWGKSFPLFLLRRIGDAVRAGGSGGSVFHNLSKSGFEALSVLLPSHNLARRFDEVAEPLIAKIVENQCQVQTLANLREKLLPRLISGQLRLADVENQIEAIAA